MRVITPIVLAACLIVSPAMTAERYPGPYKAEVVDIVDGDTIRVHAHIWPGMVAAVLVRLAGIDTPELRRGTCRDAGAAARQALAEVIGGDSVDLRDIEQDKYAGRIRATVLAGDRDVAKAMLANGWARPYEGVGKAGWCP